MNKKELIAKVCTTLKINEGEFNTALGLKDDEEVKVSLSDDLVVLTQAEQETRDTEKKNDGIKAGKEIGVKEVRTAAGLDESIGKDVTKVASAIAAKAVADAKIPANEKVTELTTQNQLLTQKLADKEIEVQAEKGKATQFTTDRKILTAMPKNRASLLEDDEMLDIIKAKHIKEVDGELVVVGKDGQPLRDKATTKPLGLSEGLTAIFAERKWIEEAGGAAVGRGGKDAKGGNGGFTKKSEVVSHYEAQGKSLNGEAGAEVVAKLQELAKADPAFDMNN